MPDPGPRGDVAELLTAHAHGWAICKADGIAQFPLGWRLRLTRSHARQRLIVTRGTPAEVLAALADVGAGTELRLCGDPGWWAAHLPAPWRVAPQGWYYVTELAGRVDPGSGAACGPGSGPGSRPDADVDLRRAGDLLQATIRFDGTPVAGGQAGVWGRWLTLDNIEVEPAWRRRGLGRRIVASLSAAGARLGCTTGVLTATPMGRSLYESLGWTLVGDQVCATYP